MKKLTLIVALVLVALSAIPAAAQYSRSGQRSAAATRSVLKQPDQVEWADYHVGMVAGPGISGCPDAHPTCGGNVCYGYDNCCCPPPLCCCLKKIARMLDCLLPCNKCCSGGCLFGGCHCQPHMFHRGCCGGCDVGCSAPSCSSPIGYPGMSDPFIDDPVQPQPMPEPTRDARYGPAPLPTVARKLSPYKVTTTREVARQQGIEASRAEIAPIAAPVPAPFNPRDKYAARPNTQPTAQPSTHSRPGPKSVLHAAAEEEIGEQPAVHEAITDAPALLPVTIRRTSAEVPAAELEIPVNPLRR